MTIIVRIEYFYLTFSAPNIILKLYKKEIVEYVVQVFVC